MSGKHGSHLHCIWWSAVVHTRQKGHVAKVEASRSSSRHVIVKGKVTIAVGITPGRRNVRGVKNIAVDEDDLLEN